jgi:DNA sulfur modification protein DndE
MLASAAFVVSPVAFAADAPPPAAGPVAAVRSWSITDYGAVGDGKAMNTDAFRKAIDACASAGGGRVLVPAGTYVSGPIELKSGIDLHLAAGATIQFSHNLDDFPLVASEYEGRSTVQARSPMWGEKLRDVSITGAGTIDGAGEAWRPLKKNKVTAEHWQRVTHSGGVVEPDGKTWWPSRAAMEGQAELQRLREGDSKPGATPRVEDYARFKELLRPQMVLLSECRNVVLDGPTFRNSPNWNINLNLCENVTLRNLTIYNPAYAQNGDGVDLGSCRNVLVDGCTVDVGDDAICLKSGRDEEGRRRGRPTENVTVRNCTVLHGHGGVVIGSEMSGGVRNVSVTNCVFKGTDTGLRFKTTRGRGGIVENVEVSNVAMSNIAGEAITFDMFYAVKDPRPEPVSERTPIFRQFYIRNITCDGAKQAMAVRGLPELPIEGLTFERVRISADEGALFVDAQDIVLRDVQIRSRQSPPLQFQNVRNLTTERVDGVVTGTPTAPTTQKRDKRNATKDAAKESKSE